jgi:hypothetical protein
MCMRLRLACYSCSVSAAMHCRRIATGTDEGKAKMMHMMRQRSALQKWTRTPAGLGKDNPAWVLVIAPVVRGLTAHIEGACQHLHYTQPYSRYPCHRKKGCEKEMGLEHYAHEERKRGLASCAAQPQEKMQRQTRHHMLEWVERHQTAAQGHAMPAANQEAQRRAGRAGRPFHLQSHTSHSACRFHTLRLRAHETPGRTQTKLITQIHLQHNTQARTIKVAN